ncbi:alpha/beta fold hydrolase [Halovivax cerinus]|uniref:Alpha/beta fold hydrolase n=1 Tax=Halovivax cerinus TaxID=1487865 RepID=A0ABD5NQQ3_9EURY|nr:alpha/beta hydrolase [Halovivax cerinus]
MPRVTRDGVELAYEVDPMGEDDSDPDATGSDTGEADERSDTETRVRDDAPVVFVPGIETGRWAWRWQREAFRGRRRVVAPFLRGTGPRVLADGGVAVHDDRGRSDAGLWPVVPSLPGPLRRPIVGRWGGYTVSDLAADLDAVLADDAALGLGRSRGRVHLVGQGLGGAIALQYAVAYGRVRSLTLVGTRHGGTEVPETPDSVRRQQRDPDGGSELARKRARLRPFLTDAFVARNPRLLERLRVWQDEQGPATATRDAQWAAWNRFDPSDRLADVSVPTLVLHGTADRIVPVENGHALAEAIPESEIELIEGGPHLVGLERADRVTDRLDSFLDAH